MSRLRFTTAQEVLEAFPSAEADIGETLGNEAPVACLHRLAEGARPDAALAFCAYVLPRREAVWWGCLCIRSLLPTGAGGSRPALDAAEAWVRRPDDGLRRTALGLGMGGDRADPSSWLALGAGWAGGSMAPGEHPVPAPAHLTAKAVRAALLLALGKADPLQRVRNVGQFVAIGSRVASGEDAL